MKRDLPHLNVKESESKQFISASTGGSKKSYPFRDREQHSKYLKQNLNIAWQTAENERAVYHINRKGIYLEVKGEPGFDFDFNSLENRMKRDVSEWSTVLNVREESVFDPVSGEDKKIICTTLFIPFSQKDKLLKKLEEYEQKNTPKGNPENAKLVDSISNIRKALEIESFWTDDSTLIPKEEPEWCEVWLSSDQGYVLDRFLKLIKRLNVPFKNNSLLFPERTVTLIKANGDQLISITRNSDDIAEYRRAKITAHFFLQQNNEDKSLWVEDLRERLKIHDSNVSICLLDSGVNNGHLLIKPVLKDENCHSVYSEWGKNDHANHGTLVAGLAIYRNLQKELESSGRLEVRHSLESVKILPHNSQTDPELWGDITKQGVSLAEIEEPDKQRIVCMTVTSEDRRDRGKPSSWSAALDKICFGEVDDIKRLFIVSAGNCADSNLWRVYPDSVTIESVHDPAQSWNALTVGAYTELDSITDDSMSDYKPLAPVGGVSPFSSSSMVWENKWPIKPEVLFEGGNLAVDSTGFPSECDDLSLLTTGAEPHVSQFDVFRMTSASAAQAAWFAAQIQLRYPEYWPETIRGLIVHSAEWTDTMKEQFNNFDRKMVKICGYGVPDLDRALHSASDSLTLISQSEIQPFECIKSKDKTKDMHLYELPWPKDVLQDLPSETNVQMRITLSYFIEPGPGEKGFKDKYKYSSHGLRFEINIPTENRREFEQRVNKIDRDEEYSSSGNSTSGYWTIGKQGRDKGSIHSDIWNGTAQELASSNLIAVYPVNGWWRTRKHIGKCNNKTRYSLIVSIKTEAEDVDIYAPVAVQIGAQIPVEIKV